MVRALLFSAAVAAAAALVAHVIFSVAAAYTMASYETRIFDVREFPDAGDFSDLVGGYLAVREATGKTVVAGSSFSFGYPYAAEVSFPAYMGAINASVIGAGLQGLLSITICELLNRNIHPGNLVVEIPLINEVGALRSDARQLDRCSNRSGISLLFYAMLNPVGLQWADLLRDPYELAKGDSPISIAPVPDSYFADPEQFETVKAALHSRIITVFEAATRAAHTAYLFITPVYIPGVGEAGRDADNVRHQFEFAQALCIQLAGERCIPTDDMLDRRDLYGNITHLGADGARYLAEKISKRLSRQPHRHSHDSETE